MDSAARHILEHSRRGLLRSGLGMAALAALQPPSARHALAAPALPRDPFTLGVASGDPWPDGVVLWTRLAPEPLAGGGMPRAAIPVRWEVAEDPGFTAIAATGEELARPELAHAVHAEVGGLLPGRAYFYRFRLGEWLSPTGRTRTAPAVDATPAKLRFVNAGCQNYQQGLYTAWRHVAEEEDLDFVFHYGDYIYESGRSASAIRPHNGPEPLSLDEYRARYALYKLDPDLAAAHAAHPFLPSFDDHEVQNNWAGPFSQDDGSNPNRPAVPPEIFALRKQAAFQAWYEHMPLRRAQLPRGPEIEAYRALRYGRLLDIAVLDTRSFRTDQPCGDGVKPACAAQQDPAAQMIGPAQQEWLAKGLGRSEARWQLLAQQVPMLRVDSGQDTVPRLPMDKWDGYPAARRRVLEALQGVPNLVVASGDVHMALAGTLRPDYDREDSPATGTEFTATSISSGGDGSESRPSSARELARNPHLAFTNNRRGYTLHEVSRDSFTATFRAVAQVSTPGAAREDRARFVVEAGRPGPQPA
ncbi:alkaline phosphatase [Pseudoroseomonas wenyumeiae]|uniref:Alkaline phosphatase n=1 Tax=Teichococcus wenyumeiae TaxID=2478470 RepID=A0A3A9JM50_9PROT|nr:alkaline phosphatase D family protein [Pseudoroseomonas wenyumeiae]RKK05615.1 alkaline phosphatase [Pseudoroseomonas wenyumeiae]RMI20066.1 alkaline phosphatase [Pseudoroseomonas wenyumeiae]